MANATRVKEYAELEWLDAHVSPSNDPLLIDAVPDLILFISREGRIVSFGGGRGVPDLAHCGLRAGELVDSVWPEAAAHTVMQLVRKSIKLRKTLAVNFADSGRKYTARVAAQGPARALCVISGRTDTDSDESTDGHASFAEAHARELYADRREFRQRLDEAVALRILTEKPASILVMLLDGIGTIENIDESAAENALDAVLLSVSLQSFSHARDVCVCFGPVSAEQIAFVLTTTDRQEIDHFITEVFGTVTLPVILGPLTVKLTPYTGVAILARDGVSTKGLLDNARIAAVEARRTSSARARFFSDTMALKTLARLDVGRELRAAIEARDIGLRHVGRHDLKSGRLVTQLAYCHWQHALRGDVPPREFLAVAEATGAAVDLSRCMLEVLGRDYADLCSRIDPDVGISFGPLRQHLLHAGFVADIQRSIETHIPPGRLEIRVAEQTFAILSSDVVERLATLGVRLTVDEIGRGLGSLDKLARSSVWGMQLDRAWVEGLATSEIARRVCRAGIASALALDICPIAMGVDDEQQRQTLVSLGCGSGSGDLYGRDNHSSRSASAISQTDTLKRRDHRI